MTRALLGAAVLATAGLGCSTLTALTAEKSPPRAPEKPIVVYEAGMTEVETGSVGEDRDGKADHWGLGAGFTLYKNTDYKQAKKATDRLLSADQAGREVQGELGTMRAKFARLVEKYGR